MMRNILKSLCLMIPLLVAGTANAQLINTNDTSVCPGTTITLSANGSTVFSLTDDDRYSPTINLPFTFNFYGIDYNIVSISSNGYVQFRTVPSTSTTEYSSWSITTGIPGNPNVLNSAMGFYADINMAVAGSIIQYATVGVAPNRKWVVTFCNCGMFSCTTLKATFQMIFHEGSNDIEYQIQNAPSCPSWNSGRAIQGVQNATGTAATATPGRNFPSVWSATNDGKLFTQDPGGASYSVADIPHSIVSLGPMITWYKNGVTNIGTGGTIDVTITEPAFYVAVPSSAGPCWSTALPDTVWVGIHNTAQPTVVPNVSYCQGATAAPLTATAEPGAVLYWYTAATGGTPTTTAPVPSTAVPGNTTWFVSAFKEGCESNRVPITVAILPTPSGPAVTSPVIYCQNDPATPLTATGPNIKWYTSATGGTGSSTAPTPNTAVPGNTTYYVTQTGSIGCESNRAPLTVTVHPTPSLPYVSDVTYCQGETTTPLTATGNNLLWYNVPVGGAGVTTAPTPASGTPGVFNYYVSQTINGCEGPRAHIKVTVIEKPGIPKVEDRLLCQNDQPQALTAQGSNLLWYTTASGGTGSPVAPVPPMDTPYEKDYYVTQTVNGCESNRARIHVTVNPQVLTDFNISKMPVCNTDTVTVTFTGIAPASATFQWELTNTVLLSGDPNGSGPLVVTWPSPTDASIRLTVTNLNCTDTKVWDFPVGLAVTPEFDIPDFICVDQPARILAQGNSLGGSDYFWDIDGGSSQMGSQNEQNLVSWSTPGIKTVTLRLIKDQCRSYTTTKTILVRELPIVQILDRQEQAVCEFDTVTFHASDVPGYEYLWLPSEYVWSGQGSPEVQMLARGQKNISVQVTDRYGCNNIAEIPFLVQPCCQVSMPTAFSPNGDGRNDIFQMVTRGFQPITMFRVFNRWGQMVFESKSQSIGWDGMHNGEPAPMGTYHYVIQYNCEGRLKELKGDVILVR